MIKIDENTSIVDVRMPVEFMSGHVEGSKNIPLQGIANHLDELRALPQPLVLCCASGNRSGQAAAFLKSQGIECENGGSWFDVQFAKFQS
ncbi:MAG: rhodanese-like domain-containing protein [Bacteroidia bacterium]|nr:rhodanese-like domain-containing protein [Bacteroidia bacterium]